MTEPYIPEPARIEAVGDHMVFEGRTYTNTDALGDICREIVNRIPYPTSALVYRGEMLCLTVDVTERAKRTLRESDRDGLSMGKFYPKKDKA